MEHIGKLKKNQSEINFSNNLSKITSLVLNGVEVIKETNKDEFLASGSYFMYPWTGRLKDDRNLRQSFHLDTDIKAPYKSIYPIHGFYPNADRRIVELNTYSVALEIKELHSSIPYVKEEFILNDDSLIVRTSFTNKSTATKYFAYGYHPYLTINGENIDNMSINSNITHQCHLTEDLIPLLKDNGEIATENFSLKGELKDKQFDDLFWSSSEDNPFVEIYNQEGISVKIESLNDFSINKGKKVSLNYFQIYSPSNRESLAIEPMSSPSNAFGIVYPKNVIELKPNETAEGLFKISVSTNKFK